MCKFIQYKLLCKNLYWSTIGRLSKKTPKFWKKGFLFEPRYEEYLHLVPKNWDTDAYILRHRLVRFHFCTRTPSKIQDLYESISMPYSQPLIFRVLCIAGSRKCKLPRCPMDIRGFAWCVSSQYGVMLTVRQVLLITVVIGAHPIFRRIHFVVLDPTIVIRDNQAFWPWFVVVSICSPIAVLFEPPTSKQSYHRSINQKTSIHMQKSSTSLGEYYKNAFLSHWVRCCIGDGCVQSTSYVFCRMMDSRSVISLLRLVVTDTS